MRDAHFSSLSGKFGQDCEQHGRCRDGSNQHPPSAVDRRLDLESLNSSSGSCFVATLGRGSGRLVELARIDFDTRPRVDLAVDDHTVGGDKTILDHAQTHIELAKRYVFLTNYAAIVDHEHVFAGLFGGNRLIGDEQCQISRRSGYPNAPEHARSEYVVRIVKHGAAANGTR